MILTEQHTQQIKECAEMPFGCRGNCADDSTIKKGWRRGAQAA